MKHIHFENPGAPDVLTIAESPLPVLKPDHVLMRVHYCGINRAEVLQRAGKVPVAPGQTAILGLEAAGYVLDEQLNALYPAIGIFTGGSYAQYAQIHKDHVIRLPENFTLEQGASIPEAWLTAFQLLKYIGKIEAGQNVLIYAGASGVGTAAIQLTKYFGGHAIASSSSAEKLKVCESLGADLCLNYKTNEQQAQDIMTFTKGKGVDIVLDCVAAQNYKLTDQVLALDSRWIVYGAMGGPIFEGFNVGNLMRRRVQLITTLLKSRSDSYKADLIAQFQASVLPALANGQLKPVIDRIIPVTWDEEGLKGWKQAHIVMESNDTIGKIIVAIAQEGEQANK